MGRLKVNYVCVREREQENWWKDRKRKKKEREREYRKERKRNIDIFLSGDKSLLHKWNYKKRYKWIHSFTHTLLISWLLSPYLFISQSNNLFFQKRYFLHLSCWCWLHSPKEFPQNLLFLSKLPCAMESEIENIKNISLHYLLSIWTYLLT